MKIYKKVEIDISTGKIISEDSFEYEGKLAEAKGGGGASGTVDFPEYMKLVHHDWLNNEGTDVIGASHSVTAIIEAGIAASPFAGEVAYDPDADIALFIAELGRFSTAVDSIDELTFWDQYALLMKATVDDNIIDETSMLAATTAHSDMLDDRLTTEVLPRFEQGMRDINAVISSSFVIGKAILEGFNTRDVADFDAKLRLQAYSQRNQMIASGVSDMMRMLSARLSFRDSIAKATAEMYRVKAVLKKEELTEQLDIDQHDYKWSLDLYQAGGNVLAAISGASVSTQQGPTTAQSVMGGAINGAALGKSMSDTPRGTVIGAIGGALAGAMQ